MRICLGTTPATISRSPLGREHKLSTALTTPLAFERRHHPEILSLDVVPFKGGRSLRISGDGTIRVQGFHQQKGYDWPA